MLRPALAALALAAALPLPAVAQRGPEAGLLAWYPLDGDVRDAAGRADGVVVGAVRPAEDRRGDPRGAIAFASRDAYASLGVRTEPERFTLAAWIRPARTDRDQVIFSKWSSAPGPRERWLELRIEAGGRAVLALPLGRPGRPAAIRSTRRLEPGRWVHLAATFDGEQAVLYVDGAVEAAATFPPTQPSPGPVFLGARPDPSGRTARPGTGLEGRLDDVRLYRGAADAGAVAALVEERARPRPLPPEREPEEGPETALLLRVDGLVARHDAACLRRSDRAALDVEARAFALLEDAERAARAERNGRLAGYVHRAAQELQTVRGQTDASSLDRRRSALVSLAESIWSDYATDLDDRALGRDADDRYEDRREPGWR